MTAKYYAILTNLGAGKLANAAALGTQLQITHMALGDGGGVLPTPNASQTALIGEKRRAQLNSLSIDSTNASQIIAEQVIPENEGGWWIREIGLFDADGVLIAVANCAETYKPLLQEGSGRTQTVRMILIVNSTDAVTLKIDPSVVLATRKYADDNALVARQYADSRLAAHVKDADPHPQYAPKKDAVLTGTPKAPTAGKGSNSEQIANTAFVSSEIKALGLDGSGLFGLGIRNEKLASTMSTVDVTKFDYFAPKDNIGPLPGIWCGGLTHAMGDDIGWQIAAQGLGAAGSKPRAFIRMMLPAKKLSEWGELYHSLNKPTPADVGALPAGGTAVSASKLANSRKIAGVGFDGSQDISLSADNVGAVSSGGGDYDKTFRLGAVGTMGYESNPVQLISAPAGQAANTFVAWSSYTWYSDYVRIGMVRAGDKTMRSIAIEVNGTRYLEIARDGTLLNANMASDVQLGVQESIVVNIPATNQTIDTILPSGAVQTGVSVSSTGTYTFINRIYFRRLQKKVAGVWTNVSAL